MPRSLAILKPKLDEATRPPYWFKLIKRLEFLTENQQFSVSQLKILNERLLEITEKLIEEAQSNAKGYLKLIFCAEEINTILKANYLPVPDALIPP